MYDFPNLNSPHPDSILSSKYLNADYLFEQLVKLLAFIFRKETLTNINTICIFLSIFFLTLIFYCAVRLFEIRRKEHKHLEHEIAEYAHRQKERERKTMEENAVSSNSRWIQVLEHLSSASPADWKLAVIEADSMLENLLKDLGFEGENLGERLKSADQKSFRDLSQAWEVHTIRNRIAHEGSSFDLGLREAKRIVAIYEQIFRQYGFI